MGLYLTADNLRAQGVPHGFSTRLGGVSQAPFDALNLARGVGDGAEAVETNHARLADAVGYAAPQLYEVSQVHGSRCVTVGRGQGVLDTRALEADALVTGTAGQAVGVRIADCLPVLLADVEAGVVGAAHAGWRGVEAGVVESTLTAMEALGAVRRRILAALGPSIGPCCFEVGSDVAERIAHAADDSSVIIGGYDKPHVDLALAVRRQLSRAQLPSGQVTHVEGCTFCDPEHRFFSYRRDGKRSGRQLAVVVAPTASAPDA